MPTPLGPSTASTSPSSSARSNVDAALLEPRLHPHAAHTGPARRRLAEAITITAATTMSNSDSATAASAIGLALQVDLQRQRPRDALQRAGEGQGRPELAERARERQDRSRHQPGQHQRQRHGPQHGGGPGAERGGDVFVVGPAERSAPSRLTTRNGSDTKDCASTTAVVENAIRMPSSVELMAEQALPAEGVEQRDPADDRGQDQRKQHQRAQHRLAGESAAGQDQRHRHADHHAYRGAGASAVFKLKTSAAREDSEVTSGMKCAQSILSRIATSGTMTNSAPTAAGR